MWLSRSIAAASVAGLLITVPVVDLAQAAAPHPVSGHDHEVDLSGGGTVSAARAGAPAQPASTVKEVRVGSGALVGVTLDGAAAVGSVRVRVQDDDGAWGRWTSLGVEDGGPDAGTAEARRATVATDPLWIGEGDDDRRVQVQLPAAAADDAALAVVDPGSSAADRAVTRTGPASSASAAPTSAPFIHSRRDWGADESLRSCQPSYNTTVRAAVLHHTDGANGYSQAEVPGLIRSVYRYHTQTQGWCDIGYNVLVDRFGGLWEGRAGGLDRAVVGAHAGGFNKDTFGVSMLGDYTSTAPSAATLESVARVMAWKLGGSYRDPRGTVVLTSAGGGTSRYPAGTSVTLPTIFGHRDVGATACPGNVGYTTLPWIRSRVAQLIGSPSGVVYDKWRSDGGASGPLGEPSTTEGTTPDGVARYTHFQGSSIYWTAATGAHDVRGTIRARWSSLGWERSLLGYPVSDEQHTPDGRGAYSHFQGGSIYSSATTGAWELHGDIRRVWASLGWERSVLGYPTTDETPTPDGRGAFNHFQGGSIYSTATTGSHVLTGRVLAEWASLGWERSVLGYPVTDTTRTPDGRGTYQHFERGSVYSTAATGTHDLTGGVRSKWASMGWEGSWLGYPTTDTGTTPDGLGTFQHFQGGSVYRTAATGAHAISAPVRDRWAALGWETSALGYPTGDTTPTPTGSRTAFEGGTITWDASTGATAVQHG